MPLRARTLACGFRHAVTDLAVAKVGRKNVPAAKFNTDTPQVGSLDVVLGSPLGRSHWVTSGILTFSRGHVTACLEEHAL